MVHKSAAGTGTLSELVSRFEGELLTDWLREQEQTSRSQTEQSELRSYSTQFLSAFRTACESGETSIQRAEWAGVREVLERLSASRALKGHRPTETATFVFSLKQPIFALLQKHVSDTKQLLVETWNASTLVDKLGLHTIEAFQKNREDLITRQQQEMLELSTPVVRIFEGVLAVPLVGTLDSARTQLVMESLLQKIVESRASIAIIDITGVPTVDTLVAQHLLKTVAAARLMGADCIISGIRPQIAQTIVHLGVDLEKVITKATLADALMIALQRTGFTVARKPGADK